MTSVSTAVGAMLAAMVFSMTIPAGLNVAVGQYPTDVPGVANLPVMMIVASGHGKGQHHRQCQRS
jgi:hypothetical protein